MNIPPSSPPALSPHDGFGSNAAEYERARPGYPAEMIDALRRHLGIHPGARVLDLAAGTGKLTRLLASAGFDLVAVEPVAAMRVQLREVLPDVEVLDGTAENLPFADGSLDAVTVAQAFHWFRTDEALAEIIRVLRPGGGLAVAFNRRDESVEWVSEMSRLIDWHGQSVSSYEHTDWAAVLRGAGLVDVAATEIGWQQPMTRALLADRVRSVSYIGAMAPDEQQIRIDRVVALAAGFAEPFDLPYTTLLWTARRP